MRITRKTLNAILNKGKSLSCTLFNRNYVKVTFSLKNLRNIFSVRENISFFHIIKSFLFISERHLFKENSSLSIWINVGVVINQIQAVKSSREPASVIYGLITIAIDVTYQWFIVPSTHQKCDR